MAFKTASISSWLNPSDCNVPSDIVPKPAGNVVGDKPGIFVPDVLLVVAGAVVPVV